MCHALFGTGSAPIPDMSHKNTWSEYALVDAPFLRALSINCMAGRIYRSEARICGRVQEYPFFSHPGSSAVESVLMRCMRALFEQGKCPCNVRLSLFGAQPGPDEDRSIYSVFNRRDIAANVTYSQPFNEINSTMGGSYLIRTLVGEDLLSTAVAIQDLAEGQVCRETTNGFRFPSEFLREQSGEMGYIIQKQPILDAEAWRMQHPRKSCQLWVNERKTGTRLLEAVKRDGIFDTIPLKEKTPAGWERDSGDLMRLTG